jgi:hypothetical protein
MCTQNSVEVTVRLINTITKEELNEGIKVALTYPDPTQEEREDMMFNSWTSYDPRINLVKSLEFFLAQEHNGFTLYKIYREFEDKHNVEIIAEYVPYVSKSINLKEFITLNDLIDNSKHSSIL